MPRERRVAVMAVAMLAAAIHLGAAQTPRVNGRVIDAASSQPVSGAAVRLVADGVPVAVDISRDDGRFAVSAPVGRYRIVVAHIGHRAWSKDSVLVTAAGTDLGDIALEKTSLRLDEVVVTASRRPERMLDAPASIFSVTPQGTIERAATTHVDHLRDIPGLDVASGGIVQSNVVARGFNALFSGDLMMLVDNRFAFVPSLRVNVPSLIAPSREDVDHIEVLLGPGAALYGPNAANGVVHIVTKSPFESRGTTVSVEGGERDLVRTAFRHASVFGNFGVKVSGEMLSARDFPSVDSVEQQLIAARKGAPRDFGIRRNALELRADYRPDSATEVIATAGRGEIGSSLEPTGESGTVQVHNWVMSSYQLRARRGQAFGQVFLTTSNAGQTTPLRSGVPVVDRSHQIVGQLQHGLTIARNALTYGLDVISTTPVTGGTINGDNENDDAVLETGGYVHDVITLSKQFELAAAARVDKHNRLEHAVFSPRVALTYKPSPTQHLHLSYNRAFATPANYQFFADETVQPLAPGLPYQLQLVGMPTSGFQFRRDCSGGAGSLCMRSPLSATPNAFVAASAASMWSAAVNAIAPLLPAEAQPLVPLFRALSPTSAQVATQLAVLNTSTGTFDAISPSSVNDFSRLRPTLSNVVELGYKGTIGSRVAVTADGWRQVRHDFTFFSVVTPNVFFDRTSLQTYLTGAFSAAGVPNAATTAATFAQAFASLPLGTVQPDSKAVGANDIVLSYRNFARVSNWGIDLGQEVVITPLLSAAATYSFLNKNLFTSGELQGDEVALNAPRHKGSLALRFHDDVRAFGAELRGRHVSAFPVHAGVYNRDVATYNLLDATTTWRPRWTPGLTWGVTATNLLNHSHYEFAGGAALGRLVVTRVQYDF
ncbi:MAG TPA: TonB-dependent receptor [Gemmatimonadaceae bacterium]